MGEHAGRWGGHRHCHTAGTLGHNSLTYARDRALCLCARADLRVLVGTADRTVVGAVAGEGRVARGERRHRHDDDLRCPSASHVLPGQHTQYARKERGSSRQRCSWVNSGRPPRCRSVAQLKVVARVLGLRVRQHPGPNSQILPCTGSVGLRGRECDAVAQPCEPKHPASTDSRGATL